MLPRLLHLCTLLSVIFMAASAAIHAQTDSAPSISTPPPADHYQRYLRTSSADLLKNGWRFLYHTSHPDSAMLCFTIVAERVHDQMSEREKKECFEAWCGRWETNNWAYINYEACLQDYAQLTTLQNQWGIKSARPLYYLAMHKIYEYNIDPEGIDIHEPVDHLKKAFQTAVSLHDNEIAVRAFSNLVRIGLVNPEIEIKEEWPQLRKLLGDKNPELDIPGQMYSVMESHRRGDIPLTLTKLDRLMSHYRTDSLGTRDARDYASLLFIKAVILMREARYEEAIHTFLDVIRASWLYNQRELRQITFETLADIYQKTGERQKLEETMHHAVMLKDSIWNSRITKGLEQIKFDDLHKEIRRQMIIMEYRQKVLRWVIFAAIIVILCFALFVYSLRSANRKLRERNNMLYDNVRCASVQPQPEQSEQSKEQEQPEQLESTDPVAKRPKQIMSAAERNRLAREIEKTILRTDAPFSGDFSLTRLAQLVGSNTRYVSLVINEVFGCNFQTYVNNARIREVCRRIDNPREWGDFSTDGIAESVGFNSRSTFQAAFKKNTGLTAAEYRKISTERHKKGLL